MQVLVVVVLVVFGALLLQAVAHLAQLNHS
jgi:hypothetical protein